MNVTGMKNSLELSSTAPPNEKNNIHIGKDHELWFYHGKHTKKLFWCETIITSLECSLWPTAPAIKNIEDFRENYEIIILKIFEKIKTFFVNFETPADSPPWKYQILSDYPEKNQGPVSGHNKPTVPPLRPQSGWNQGGGQTDPRFWLIFPRNWP